MYYVSFEYIVKSAVSLTFSNFASIEDFTYLLSKKTFSFLGTMKCAISRVQFFYGKTRILQPRIDFLPIQDQFVKYRCCDHYPAPFS